MRHKDIGTKGQWDTWTVRHETLGHRDSGTDEHINKLMHVWNREKTLKKIKSKENEILEHRDSGTQGQ